MKQIGRIKDLIRRVRLTKMILLVVMIASQSNTVWAQKSKAKNKETKVTIKVKNTNFDTALVVYYYADKVLIKDTLVRTKDRFEIKDTINMMAGVYGFLSVPGSQFFQFVVNEKEQPFTINVDGNDFKHPNFDGSKDNLELYTFIKSIDEKQRLKANLNDKLMDSTIIDKKPIQDKLIEVDKGVSEYLENFVKDKPTHYISTMFSYANMNIEIPEFEGSKEEVELAKFNFYRKHYFDHIDLKNTNWLRTPFLGQKMEKIVDVYSFREPDSIIATIDWVLGQMDPSTELFKHYLGYYLYKFGNSQIIGHDAIYVHLAQNYYGKGYAPWVAEDNMAEILKTARLTAPTLIGKTAPPLTTYKKDGSTVDLHKLNKDFTVLIFWRPDCSHCTEAMPHVRDFQKRYKDSVDIMTVCIATGEKADECWPAVKEKGMETFINTFDPEMQSRFNVNYYPRTTPLMFILDKKKKIILKKLQPEKLIDIMEVIKKEPSINNY